MIGNRKRIPFIAQSAATDCGAACLAMVLAWYGKKVPTRDILEVLLVGRDGSNAEGLMKAAEHFGLRGRGVRAETISSLRQVPKGSVLHWGFRHFVVLERMTKDGAIVVDPAIGRRELSEAELRRSFTGVALLFEPSDTFEPSDERRSGLKRYIRPILSQSPTLIRLMALSLLVQVLGLGMPLLTGAIVDRVVPRQDFDLLWLLTVGLAGIVGFQFISSLIRSYLMIQLRTTLDAKVTLGFLDHLVALPYSFFQIRSTGDLMMRLNSNATVREILTSTALTGIFDGVLVCFYLILLFGLSPVVGGLALGLGAMRVCLFVLTRRRHRDLMSQILQTQAVSRGYQVQMLSGIETLKAMGVERQAVHRWSNLFADELNASIARDRLNAIFQALLTAFSTFSSFAILVIGAHQVLEGNMTLGTMLALSALAAGFLGPLSALVSTALQLQLLGSYLDRINDVFDTAPEQDQKAVRPAPRLRGEIELDRVSFRYNDSGPNVIDEVSLRIEAGRFVALVGPSGSGKTTLAHLLIGLYNPSAGRILYDGDDLQTLELRSLRSQLGVVTQHPYLLGSSIRANIALADPTIPLERIVRAAKLARVHDEIMAMPMGYETVIGSGGASLSGGQRQRVALARALVHQPAVVLLDEATSELDTATEKMIQRELDRLRCTRIVIAHRLSTVQGADLILVINGGKVTEQGTHTELAAQRGTYSTLVSAQALQSK